MFTLGFYSLKQTRMCFTLLRLGKPGVGNLLNEWATSSPNKVPAGRHHSSGPKEKSFCQIFRPFFRRIDGKDKKKSSPEIRPFFGRIDEEMGIISAAYWCITIIEKEKRSRAR